MEILSLTICLDILFTHSIFRSKLLVRGGGYNLIQSVSIRFDTKIQYSGRIYFAKNKILR